ncbi:hypothetical protein [Campylobacter sp. 19-13652]|uniref:hypothetical protein n=1 Tax=Campylobacter sp. 19-13652 TaxID=2840180 RepID=UPI001C73FF44|nr:hypothetical protein [Campylobacter sp. 19-13652]BCX79539.1 hypothetical protein LBC_10010 [Campylobacter sp. 19-13652]
MSETLFIYTDEIFKALRDLSGFVSAYFSVVGGIFISCMPLPTRLSAAIFFGLNLFIFLWIFCIFLGKTTSLKNVKLWLCAMSFGVAKFLFSDEILLCAIFLFITGAYLYFSKDSLASLKLFERLRIKFNQQRSKYESTH